MASKLAPDFFGWEMLYDIIKSVVRRKADVVIAMAHFLLTKHYKMQCVGVGEDKTLSENDVGSELLPDGWNVSDQRYSLRYIHNGQLYLLFGHPTEDFITMNFLDVKQTTKVSNLTLYPGNIVKQTGGTLWQMMPDVSCVASQFRIELVDPVFTGDTKDVTTQTTCDEVLQTPPTVPVRPIPVRPRSVVPNVRVRVTPYPVVGLGNLEYLVILEHRGPGNPSTWAFRPRLYGFYRRNHDFGPHD